jgi:hypothetical protein
VCLPVIKHSCVVCTVRMQCHTVGRSVRSTPECTQRISFKLVIWIHSNCLNNAILIHICRTVTLLEVQI